MKTPTCKVCNEKPCEKSDKWYRKTCWTCRVKPENNQRRMREYGARLKKEVVIHYGGRCFCCGESNIGFLTVDHINNDGAEFRKNNPYKRGRALYSWIIQNNFPKDLQVLCFNCNCGKNTNGGICPHKLI